MRESLRHGLVLAIVVSAVVAVAGAPLSGIVLRLFGAAPEVVAAGRAYLAILLAALPGFFAGMVLYAGFQSLGDTRTPMFISLATNVVNLVLDPILIFGWLGLPRMAAAGAAWATIISQSGGLVAMAVILQRRGLLTFFGPLRTGAVRTILDIGVPAGFQAVTRPLTGMLMFGIATRFGTEATAAFGIGLRILGVIFIYLGGLASAGQTLVGQSLGQARPELAWRVAQRLIFIALLLQVGVMPLLFFFAAPLVAVFNANPDVVRFGVQYLRVLAPMLVVLGLSTGWESAQRGAGATRAPMIAAFISNWGVKIPAALVFAGLLGYGVTGIWLGIGVSILVEAGILAIGYYRGHWLHKEVAWEAANAG